jgi:hypothetical protein
MREILRGSALKRVALTTALGAVVVAAVLGIVALLGGGFGDTEGKILTTSLLVTAAAVVSLACAVALEAGRLGRLPYAGIAASLVSFAMFIAGIWVEIRTDAYWKAAITLLLIALAIAHSGLLDLARLSRLWPLRAAQILTALAAVLIVIAMWAEIDAEGYWRGTGVVLVLFAAATVAVPILHRMADIPPDDEAHRAVPAVVACPFCGSSVAGIAGSAITCSACDRRWRVEPV